MSDGVTPRCLLCGEPVDLVAHMEHLDTNQDLINRRLQMAPELPFRAAAICEACREDSGRCIFDGPPIEEVMDDSF
jgi:hypothetical protein